MADVIAYKAVWTETTEEYDVPVEPPEDEQIDPPEEDDGSA